MSVPPTEFRAALAGLLGSPIRRLRCSPGPYATSHRVELLAVALADGRRLRLIFKDLSPSALLPEARGVRPAFITDPAREGQVYRHLLAGAGPGAPAFYGAISDSRADRHWLFIERVIGRPLWERGRFSSWLQAARALARLHARRAPTASDRRAARLLRYDASFCRAWMERALANRPSRRLERLVGPHRRAVEILLSRPLALIHGECFASNILIAGPAATPRVCLIDWESAGCGSGLLDLAALAAGWDTSRQHALCVTYAAEAGLSSDELGREFACARLQLAIQMLGWSRRWRAPGAHRRDWLGEACSAARDARL